MASNHATARLLARLPSSITVIEIADDIYVCDEQHIPAIRLALANQPQILYFLDRNIRADEVQINEAGDTGWALRHADAPVVTQLSVIQHATVTTTNRPIVVPLTEQGTTYGVSGFSSAAAYGTGYVWTQESGGFGAEAITAGELLISTRRFGPYDLGRSGTVKWQATGSVKTASEVASLDQSYLVNTKGSRTEKRFDCTTVVTLVPAVVRSLRTNLVMIAGPATCDYAELMPGFEWIMGSFPAVGERMAAAVSHIKRRDPSVDVSDFEARQAELVVQTDSSFIAFRGSVEFDPLELWPLAKKALKVPFEQIGPQGDVLSSENIERGKSQWKSGKWCLTVAAPAVAENEMRAEFATSTHPVSIKPSGNDRAHVSDTEGTIDMSFSAIPPMVAAFRANGRVVTVIDSPFITAPHFDTTGWLKILDAIAEEGETEPDVSGVTPAGDQGGLGETICVRLLSEPMFTPEEERLVLPTLSPQYFWSDFARKAAVTPPVA